MATILPEGLYNASTYTITWDENELAFYRIDGDKWLKNVGYFGLGTDAPGTNEGVVVIDANCIRSNLREYTHYWKPNGSSGPTVTVNIFDTLLARYQIPAFHIDNKKMIGLGIANYSTCDNLYNFKEPPTGNLNITKSESVPVINSTNVLKFGWVSDNIQGFKEKFETSSGIQGIVMAYMATRYGWTKDVLDQASSATNPANLSKFGMLALHHLETVVRFYERNNPNVYGYTLIGRNDYFLDEGDVVLNNGETIHTRVYRSDKSYPNAISLTVGVAAKFGNETSGTEYVPYVPEPEEGEVNFAIYISNSKNTAAIQVRYGSNNTIMIEDRYDNASIPTEEGGYVYGNIIAHHSPGYDAWIEFERTRGSGTITLKATPVFHPNNKEYDFEALPYLNPEQFE